jgi:hypothetical protein
MASSTAPHDTVSRLCQVSCIFVLILLFVSEAFSDAGRVRQTRGSFLSEGLRDSLTALVTHDGRWIQPEGCQAKGPPQLLRVSYDRDG